MELHTHMGKTCPLRSQQRALFKGLESLVGNFPSSLRLSFEGKVVSGSTLEKQKIGLKRVNVTLRSQKELK